MLTFEQAAALVEYDPDTGLFRRFGHYRNRGWTAGTLHWTGYRVYKLAGKMVLAHRLAWLLSHGEWPAQQVDHADGDKANNKIGNLRLATSSQNTHNAAKYHRGYSRFKGVSQFKRNGRWVAGIKVDGKSIYLGMFDTEEDAHAAYVQAAEDHYKEFARVA